MAAFGLYRYETWVICYISLTARRLGEITISHPYIQFGPSHAFTLELLMAVAWINWGLDEIAILRRKPSFYSYTPFGFGQFIAISGGSG